MIYDFRNLFSKLKLAISQTSNEQKSQAENRRFRMLTCSRRRKRARQSSQKTQKRKSKFKYFRPIIIYQKFSLFLHAILGQS